MYKSRIYLIIGFMVAGLLWINKIQGMEIINNTSLSYQVDINFKYRVGSEKNSADINAVRIIIPPNMTYIIPTPKSMIDLFATIHTPLLYTPSKLNPYTIEFFYKEANPLGLYGPEMTENGPQLTRSYHYFEQLRESYLEGILIIDYNSEIIFHKASLDKGG
jgi:hypothetical protein